MTDEEKKKERLDKIKAAKRKWWREHGKAWKLARKLKEAGLDAREDPKES